MKTAQSTLLVLLFGFLLGACGLKGPLYLPTDEKVAKPDTTQRTETAEQEKEVKEVTEEKDEMADHCES